MVRNGNKDLHFIINQILNKLKKKYFFNVKMNEANTQSFQITEFLSRKTRIFVFSLWKYANLFKKKVIFAKNAAIAIQSLKNNSLFTFMRITYIFFNALNETLGLPLLIRAPDFFWIMPIIWDIFSNIHCFIAMQGNQNKTLYDVLSILFYCL